MIIMMKPDVGPDADAVAQVTRVAPRDPGIHTAARSVGGATRQLTVTRDSRVDEIPEALPTYPERVRLHARSEAPAPQAA